MIKRVFSDLISNPNHLNQVKAEEIVEVLNEFPYCQIAHLLMAKKLKLDDSMLFEKQLNLSAAYAPSRKILHDLIQGSAVITSDQNIIIAEEEAEIDKSNEEIIEEGAEKIISKEDQQLDNLLQSELLTSYDLSQIPSLEDPKKESTEKTINKNEKHQFSDWIKFLDGQVLTTEKAVDEIIDKFITEEPRIGEIKLEQPSFENLAKLSSDEFEQDLVTETLAKIHIDQGNKLMAIEIYEQLILKYPEKRPYFAAQINFIKK